jgi:flagellar protein FlgJ
MVAPADLSTKFALDVQAVNGLRMASKKTGQAGLEAAARQFEAFFLNMLLKSMREAAPQDSLMDSEQSRLYISMLDQQLSQTMAGRSVGLAEIMMRQLRDAVPAEPAQHSDNPAGERLLRADGSRQVKSERPSPSEQQSYEVKVPEHQVPQEQPVQQPPQLPPQSGPQSQMQRSEATEFQRKLMIHAQEASEATGIPAQFLLGQAALESGWGKRELRLPDGTPSHNLFGIKAGASWTGRVVEAVTTEYVNGVAQKTVEKFRAYHSYAESFRDYVNVLRSSSRYAGVLAQAARGITPEDFAHGLQRAGYATDPAYGEKLSRIIRNSQGT